MAEKLPAHGSYYTNPSLSTLAASDSHIVPSLIVGRHGFGEIQFEQRVDLSDLLSLDELLGEVVRFRRATCHVYPEGYQSPPTGEGLNVPATARIVRCWPRDRNEEEVFEDYIEFLRMRPETEFVSYDLKTGTWTVHVQHFSTYTASRSDYYVPSIDHLASARPQNLGWILSGDLGDFVCSVDRETEFREPYSSVNEFYYTDFGCVRVVEDIEEFCGTEFNRSDFSPTEVLGSAYVPSNTSSLLLPMNTSLGFRGERE
jgi:hypothetical protein